MNVATAMIPYGAPGLSEVVNSAEPALWIDTIGLSILAIVSRQAAHTALTKCHNGKSWRGVTLKVRAAINGKGLEC